MKTKYDKDLYRYYGNDKPILKVLLNKPLELKYLKVFRILECNLPFICKMFYKYKLNRLMKKTQIQIPIGTKIGEGFYIGHLGRIIINPKSIIGKNVNIATGVTIGQENRGQRKGCPIIGNCVWIGTNSVIVGNINIGDDVLIAPLTYVKFDVPSHSIVIGNPAKIIYRENATEGYINKKV